MLPFSRYSSRTAGFTLIELLVVIGIIALLAVIITPVVNSMMERAKSTKCLSQMRQIGLAAVAYATDNQNQLPLSSHQRLSWVATLQPYSSKKLLFRCPKDDHPTREHSYALNDRLLPQGNNGDPGLALISRLTSPRTMLLFAEAAAGISGSDHLHTVEYTGQALPISTFEEQVATKRHLGSANYLFVDGHVEALTPAAVALLLEPQISLTGEPSNSNFLGGSVENIAASNN